MIPLLKDNSNYDEITISHVKSRYHTYEKRKDAYHVVIISS
jgi:hypothetical protein